ncbi:hypothetical protein JCM19000A_31420 [Silvimonas sp. JCM 19000]
MTEDLSTDKADKNNEQLKSQRFEMLESIAAELSGEVVFPTCFDIAIRVRNAMRDPNASLPKIAGVIKTEPLVVAKLLRAANSAAQGNNRKITDVESAIGRLGIDAARSVALATAMDQLLRSRELVVFSNLARNLWNHSLLSAAAARVLAQKLTRVNPDDALLAGLIHDLGAFYMLYRAAKYPELVARPNTVEYLIAQWHGSIGESLMYALDIPEHIIEATRENDNPRDEVTELRNLTDVLFVANLLAGGLIEMERLDLGEVKGRPELSNPLFTEQMEEIKVVHKELLSTFSM